MKQDLERETAPRANRIKSALPFHPVINRWTGKPHLHARERLMIQTDLRKLTDARAHLQETDRPP